MQPLKSVFRLVSPSAICCMALIVPVIGVMARASHAGAPPHAKPWIKILHAPNIPPGPDGSGRISGKVGGVSSIDGLAVVLWANGGGTWYVQPLTAAPYTGIKRDRSFSNDTHGGDTYAALLVVKKRYHPENTLSDLPPVDGRAVLAETTSGPK